MYKRKSRRQWFPRRKKASYLKLEIHIICIYLVFQIDAKIALTEILFISSQQLMIDSVEC